MAEAFARTCAEVGRDPSTVRCSWSGPSACASTQAEAEGFTGNRSSAHNPEDDFGFVSTPEQIVEQMRPFIALVDSFLLDCGDLPNLTTLELLIYDVLPLVAQVTA